MKLISTIAACSATLAFSGLAFAGPAEDIIAKEKCGSCHTASTTKKGPSWASIAQKYKGDAAAQRRRSPPCSRRAARRITRRSPRAMRT